MTDDLVTRAKAAMEGVTAGPWQEGEVLDTGVFNWWFPPDHPEAMICQAGTAANAQFIAFARQWVPEAAARIESDAATIARLEGERDDCAIYLKDGETPRQRMDRDHADGLALMGLLAKEKARVEAAEAKVAALVEALREIEGMIPHAMSDYSHQVWETARAAIAATKGGE